MSTKRDNIYEKKIDDIAPFDFNKETVDVFDDMAVRSIPGYTQLQETAAAFAAKFYIPGTNIYDVGCSTGNTILSIFKQLENFSSLIALDNSSEMIEKAKKKCAHIPNIEFNVTELENVDFKEASVINCSYVLQFINPDKRFEVLQKMYDSLKPGGVLILAEKLKDKNEEIQELTSKLYHSYKSKRGYSSLEIKQKEKALENVLIPFTLEEYQQMFSQIGFAQVSIFLKYFNFTGFVAVK